MHIHLHHLIHYIRHARLIGAYLRFLGSVALMLLFSLLQPAGAGPACALEAQEEGRRFTSDVVSHSSFVELEGKSGRTAELTSSTKTSSKSFVFLQSQQSGVFDRLKPRIVMIPRMNRTPKPKSVYRCFTRAPGKASPLSFAPC
jgi:hypothetical protein